MQQCVLQRTPAGQPALGLGRKQCIGHRPTFPARRTVNTRSDLTPGRAGELRPDGPPNDSNDSGSLQGDASKPQQQGGWAPTQRVLQFSATYSKAEPHYLQLKDRSKWWKRGTFPKIPHDEPTDPKIQDQPVKLYAKVIPLAALFFFSSFNLTILQALKDAIVVTTCGAEALPFLASFVVLPASVLFFSYYTKLVSNVAKSRVYVLAIAPFVLFYAAFAALVYPNSSTLHFTGAFDQVLGLIPQGLHGCVKVIENWTFSLFFCMAELWGSVVIAVLFWSLANDVCTVSEAKTVYPLMGIAANIALVVAGNFMKFLNTGALANASTQVFLQTMVTTIVTCSIAMAATKFWIDRMVLKTHKDPSAKADATKKKKKKQGSLKDTLATLRSSPKIMNLALLVVCYALAHRLFEFSWKAQLKMLFPTAQGYAGALADVSIYTGYATILLMLSGKFVFEYLGWGAAALATPCVMFFAGLAFFGLSLFGMFQGGDAAVAMLTAGALAGAVTQVFARSSKFSLFDPAKEMVYIEMTKDEKSKGKAAVDLMGSQAGKSGASWIVQGALLCLGSAASCLPVLATVYIAVIGTWTRAALKLRNLMAETEVERQTGQGLDNGSPGGSSGNGSGTRFTGDTGNAGSEGARVTRQSPAQA